MLFSVSTSQTDLLARRDARHWLADADVQDVTMDFAEVDMIQTVVVLFPIKACLLAGQCTFVDICLIHAFPPNLLSLCLLLTMILLGGGEAKWKHQKIKMMNDGNKNYYTIGSIVNVVFH